jgi:WD40 repeat protein
MDAPANKLKPSGEELPVYKYWAFISYSQKDERWARRLHEALETYAIPKELVGRETPPWGPLPKRFTPVFRDRDELSSAADLGEKLTSSLHSSRALVVLCSPHAARSRWVDEEIKTFKARGREQDVFAVIVDGEPCGSDSPETAAAECFPAALRYRVNERRELTAERAEPIAGDARKDKDGFERAMLKTVAGILRVDFSNLVKREEERKARRNRIAVAVLAAVLAVVSALAVWAFVERSRAAAEARRAQRQATSSAAANLIDEDPLEAALVLLALRGGSDPDGALQAAIRLDSTAIPKAVLRDKATALDDAAFTDAGAKVRTASYETRQSWNADGTGKPVWLEQRTPADGLEDAGRATLRRQVLEELARRRGFELPDGQWLIDINGELIATAANHGHEVFIWKGNGEDEPVTIEGHQAPIESATFSPDGKTIAIASQDAAASVWPVSGAGPPWLLLGHTAWVTKAAFSPDGDWVLTTSGMVDGAVRVWPARNMYGPVVLRGHAEGAQSAAFSPDGGRVAIFAGDGAVWVWNADSHGDPVVLRGPRKTQFRAASFSPDGQRVVAPYGDGTAWIWNASGRGEPVVLRGDPGDAVYSAAFSADGRYVVTASGSGAVRVWNADGGKPVELKGQSGTAFSAAFSPDGKRVVSRSNDGTARVENADGTGSVVVLQHPTTSNFFLVNTAAFSPDGRRVVTGAQDAVARIWNADQAGDPILLKGHRGQVFEAAFSPDGTRVVTASSDGTARVWDAASGKQISVLTGHTARVSSAVFSPDSQRVLTCSIDGTARLWDLRGNRQLAVLEEDGMGWTERSWINRASFSPDGRRVVTASNDGTARVWLVDWELLLERLASRTTACLGAGDRERYLGEDPALARQELERCETKYGRS